MAQPLPASYVDGFDDCQLNFEFLAGAPLSWGASAPPFTPQNNAVTFYLRTGTPGVANQRIYIYNGSAWVGIV